MKTQEAIRVTDDPIEELAAFEEVMDQATEFWHLGLAELATKCTEEICNPACLCLVVGGCERRAVHVHLGQ